jgi:16S rRNA (cytosine967-C5)-methyltransferase
VLDACAGRGQKATLLAERMEEGRLVAADLYPEKLEAMAAELTRLHLPTIETRGVDWTVGQGGLPDDFDRVLVDAPCSGSGTLRRRPEILRRLQPGDPERLGRLAESILRSAASRARRGGVVLFAVCSVLREECEDVVARVTDVLEPSPFDAPELAGELVTGHTALRLLTGLHGTDGYFMASFRRR